MTSITDTVNVRADDLRDLLAAAGGGAACDPGPWARLTAALDGHAEPAGEGPWREYAQVQITGYQERIGWVTEGTLAGAPVLVISDDNGRVQAKVPPSAVHMFVPLGVPPLVRPVSPQPALPAGAPEPQYLERLSDRCICGPDGPGEYPHPHCPDHGVRRECGCGPTEECADCRSSDPYERPF